MSILGWFLCPKREYIWHVSNTGIKFLASRFIMRNIFGVVACLIFFTHTDFFWDRIHFYNYCSDPLSEEAHQEEEDFYSQTSPWADSDKDNQRNTETLTRPHWIWVDMVKSNSRIVLCNFMKHITWISQLMASWYHYHHLANFWVTFYD